MTPKQLTSKPGMLLFIHGGVWIVGNSARYSVALEEHLRRPVASCRGKRIRRVLSGSELSLVDDLTTDDGANDLDVLDSVHRDRVKVVCQDNVIS